MTTFSISMTQRLSISRGAKTRGDSVEGLGTRDAVVGGQPGTHGAITKVLLHTPHRYVHMKSRWPGLAHQQGGIQLGVGTPMWSVCVTFGRGWRTHILPREATRGAV